MILNGECGAFNPMLLDCLQEISMRPPERTADACRRSGAPP